jgi:hypothetical protein
MESKWAPERRALAQARNGDAREQRRPERDCSQPLHRLQYTAQAGAVPRLLDCDGLRQVARLVDVQAAQARDPVGQQLQRHHREHGLQERR